MPVFLERQHSLDSYWRAIILFGRNVASYKFAPAKSLGALSAQGKTNVSLEEVAVPFFRSLIEHLRLAPKQATSASSDMAGQTPIHLRHAHPKFPEKSSGLSLSDKSHQSI